MTLLTIAAVAGASFLGWNLYRKFGSDRIAELIEKRRAISRLVSRGEFVDGSNRMDVALAITQDTFFYANSDMQASLNLQWIREVEYDSELATGGKVADGKVLRLRSGSQSFEFVLPADVVDRWHMTLPPRREPIQAVSATGGA